MENIILKNNCLEVEINPFGAEIKKITDRDGNRLLHDGKSFWNGTAPVLFPICGRLADDKYTVYGKEYNLEKHGFANGKTFAVESADNTSAVFVITHDEETLKSYPFEFELRIKYAIIDAKLEVVYEVKNLSDKEMYFSIGAHEGVKCDGGLADTELVFEKEETLYTCEVDLDTCLMTGNSEKICENTNILPLKEDFFKIDALVFKTLNSRGLTVVNKTTGRKVKAKFEGFSCLLIWSAPGADFICVEPWCGYPDELGKKVDFSEKFAIVSVGAGKTETKVHSLEFEHLN